MDLRPALLASAVFSANAFADRGWDDDDRYERRCRHEARRVIVYEQPQVVYQAPPQVVYQAPPVEYRERIVYRDRPVYYAPPAPRYYDRPADYPRYNGNHVVGQAVGARDWARAHATIKAGLLLAAGLSTLVGLLLWLAAAPLIAAYTDDPAVHAVAGGLIIFVALYQFFDALQTVAGHALRAYRVTFVPMLVQILCFWGIGLLGGGWLCFRWSPPLGVAGFWLASVASLVLAASLLLPLLRKAIQALELPP